ncbi:MAG TPA: 4,5-DOPA dioxygenase extradiol [Halieaceae bacterium]|nr:4,5-DOPA dioxygenase extradiol [Halieaceae bacterium]
MATEHIPGTMPTIFAGHGSPMNALEENRWSRGFAALTQSVPSPRAIIAISAHWFVDGTWVMANEQPRTIHDFGGFPQALYEIHYPASGHADLAQRVLQMLGPGSAGSSMDWGLDHGTWSVLRWMYPKADIPVIQLSIDRRLSPRRHFEIGRTLAPLREEGVLILASGNVVHNLRDASSRMRTGDLSTPDWARRFDNAVVATLEQRDYAALLSLASETDDGLRAHPTPDHWLPLLYVAGASNPSDRISHSSDGFDLGSLSMRNILFGGVTGSPGRIPKNQQRQYRTSVPGASAIASRSICRSPASGTRCTVTPRRSA